MCNLVNYLVVACALIQVVHGVYPMTSHQNSPNIFSRTRLPSRDPVSSMACFSQYIVKSNEVSEIYSRNYNQCLLDAKAGRQAIEEEMVDKRIAIEEISHGICKRLSTCDGLNSTLDVFNCHARIGSNNTKAVYSISGNASEYANIMHEKYRVIDLRHEQCCKTSERSYVESTAANYRYLQDCLDGRIQPSTTTTTTETIATSTTTTSTSSPTETEVVPEIIDTTTSDVQEVLESSPEPVAERYAKLLKLFN